MRHVILVAMVFGCNPVSEEEFADLADHDDDGFLPPEVGGDDCDDENADVNPDEPEVCGDGLDNDCSGVADDSGEQEVRFWFDADGDGLGAPDGWVEGCAAPENYVTNDQDCDDADEAVGLPVALFTDADSDGWGVGSPIVGCPAPGLTVRSGDCDDATAGVHPGAAEAMCSGVDDDCDPLGTPDGPVATATLGSYDDIQLALDSDSGDLRICPGAWAGPWVVSRAVVIEAVQPGGVVLTAPTSGPTVRVDAGGTVALDGIVIEGGVGDPARDDLGGAVSNLDPATTLTLSSVVIIGGTADRGGGVGSRGPLVLDDTEIGGASALGEGGGVWTEASLTATDSTIEANSADHGGGIYGTGQISLDATRVADNTATRGGGIWTWGELVMSGASEISRNSAADAGGGIYMSTGSTASASDAVVRDNLAAEGAGVWLTEGQWTGGSILANVATVDGGGLLVNGTGSVSGATIEGNTAEQNGGGILFRNGGDLTVHASTIRANTAIRGGGLMAYAYFLEPTVTLTEDVFEANSAVYGGGLTLQNVTTIGDGLTVVSDGEAVQDGGGVALYHAVLSNVLVRANVATRGGGIAALSDSIFDGAPLANALVAVDIEDNLADEGAGLFVAEDQSLPIDGSSVLRNIASEAGGGAFLAAGDSELVSTATDFGTGADDNAPEDVRTPGGAFELTGAGTWTCTGLDGCF